MKKEFQYTMSVMLSALDAIGIAVCALGALYTYTSDDIPKIVPALLGVCAVFLAVMIKPLGERRIKARKDASMDEYGISKKQKDYDHMSVREQEELDRLKMLELERVLPSTTVQAMMHEGSTDPEKDMQKLVGMKNVKAKMEEMAAMMEFMQKKGEQIEETMHMCFFGAPGTGKTTCARIMTGYLYKYGYIKKNKVIETDGNFLAEGDQASMKTENLIRRAFGGVLFIDEAYSLLQSRDGGKAISTLIKQMEDNRDKFVLILAGYEDEMKILIQSNPGFLSRIKEYFYFENYSIGDLTTIFINMADAKGFKVKDSTLARFREIIEEQQSDRNFGNVRTVRNILEQSISRHALNIKKGIVRQPMMLYPEDITYFVMKL